MRNQLLLSRVFTRRPFPAPARARRGSAVVEFAIGFTLLLTVFAGVYQFGYTFYVYNTLESAVRDGARYGSVADYDGGAWNGTSFTAKVQNMVTYGVPSVTAPSGAKPVVLGLTPSKVVVTPTLDSKGVPSRIKVKISGFAIPDGLGNIFGGFTLNGKPAATFDYMGRFTVP